MASKNSYTGRTSTDVLHCLPNLNPDQCDWSDTAFSGPQYHRHSREEDLIIGDLPQSFLENKAPLRLLVLNESTEVRKAFCEVAASLGFLVDETGSAVAAREILVRRQTDLNAIAATDCHIRHRIQIRAAQADQTVAKAASRSKNEFYANMSHESVPRCTASSR